MSLPWWLAAVLAGVMATYVENRYRVGDYSSFARVLISVGPWMVAMQYMLWRTWRDAPTLMLAWITFSVATSLLRLANAQWAVKEPPTATTLAGVGLMLLAAYLIKIGAK